MSYMYQSGMNYQNNYNPYQNNMNYNNPYQQPQLQMQQQYQQPVQVYSNLFGRVVDDFDNIKAKDVPMDQSATFVKNDGSEIQVRSWNKYGTIDKVVYKPILDTENQNSINPQLNTLNALNEDMRAFRDEINARFDKLEKSIGSKTKVKKEVLSDEHDT